MSMEAKLFFAPGFFVDVGKRDFAIALVETIDARLTFSIKISL